MITYFRRLGGSYLSTRMNSSFLPMICSDGTYSEGLVGLEVLL